ncbi:hypothetical protein ABT369_47865 [Dactylosporangium sp. NPDC000244]|uniref:hypothetical protein n=1 Tax=Dactylosporangium sp. NPDC000244 TaxID=3154365 RepID=UPI0033206D4A
MTAICILSSAEDVHARRVFEEVAGLGADVAIVDLSGARELTFDGDAVRVDDAVIDGGTVVWSRRPGQREVDARVVDHRLVTFVQHQWQHGFHGAVAATGCRIVNDPQRERRAQYKPWQLAVAAASGLRVPRTLVTNAPGKAEAFRAELARLGHRTIFKPLTPLLFHLGETREFTEGLATGETLELAPVIFQQCVERGVDLRLFVVGDRVVPAAVRSRHDELIDWRVDPDAAYEPAELPPATLRSVAAAVAAMGLDTASVDLRLDDRGDLYFFEANPAGQFLMLEPPLQVNLSRILAEHLIAQRTG